MFSVCSLYAAYAKQTGKAKGKVYRGIRGLLVQATETRVPPKSGGTRILSLENVVNSSFMAIKKADWFHHTAARKLSDNTNFVTKHWLAGRKSNTNNSPRSALEREFAEVSDDLVPNNAGSGIRCKMQTAPSNFIQSRNQV